MELEGVESLLVDHVSTSPNYQSSQEDQYASSRNDTK
jgi:hypothetical protein